MRLKFFLAALFACTLSNALEESEIDTVIGNDIAKASAILQDKNINDSEKSQRIFAMFDSFFDFKQMAEICLGKAQWKTLNSVNGNQR